MVDRRVPFITLRPYLQLVGGFCGAPFADDMMGLLGSLELIGGPTIASFENKLAAKLGAKHAVACANGTDALVLALRALGVDRNSRVAIPNLTFWATYEAVVQIGATPVVLDIDPDDLQMDYSAFVRAHDSRRFDAAILVHLYGWCSARLPEFRSLCRTRKIPLVEDGAQAFGVAHGGQSIFADADAITLSFHPAKVMGAVGDAGAVLSKHARVAEHVRMFANHGRTDHYAHAASGYNSRMDAIQAAWLLRALDRIDEVLEARRAVFERYYGASRWFMKRPPRGVVGNGYLNVTLVEGPPGPSVDTVRSGLREKGIETGRVYPNTIIDQVGADAAIISSSDYSISRDVARRVTNLPLFYGITDAQVDHVLEALR